MWLGGAAAVALASALVLPTLSSGAPAPSPPATAVRSSGPTLVTATAKGAKANGESASPALSADGNRVAFVSTATNLDTVDQDDLPDVYVKDLASGAVMLSTTGQGGVKANGGSASPALSADGRLVAFVSTATNLHPDDRDALADVYVKDFATGALMLASTGSDGRKADAASEHPALSADGSRVAFTSRARNLDPADDDDIADVYVKDVSTGSLTLASASRTGRKADRDSVSPTLSGDGQTVAFATAASTLDPGDRPEVFDVYVKDLRTGGITLASAEGGEIGPDDESREPVLSADGKIVAFTAGPIPSATDETGIANVFTRDLATGHLTLVSTPGGAAEANGSSGEPALCANGTLIAFATSATNLVPNGHSGHHVDVVVKNLSSGVFAATGGAAHHGPSGMPAMSDDGRTVAFVSPAAGSASASSASTSIERLADIYVVRWRDACES